MRKRLLPMAAILVFTAAASAHPGIGIVMDSRGNVFYTDLKQVWKVSPDGRKTVAVRNVHTHELHVDAGDNLYGEHLWYEGEATDKWGHYVWKLHSDGTLEQVIPPQEGFLQNYSFVRDRAGNMYWADRGAQTIIRKRAADGTITDFCNRHDFRDVRWMTVSEEGTVFLIDDGDLLRITPDRLVATLAHNLGERSLLQFFVGDRHNLMGLWLDAEGSVYVAVYGGRVVKKIGKDGKVEVVAHSKVPWSPTGGFIAKNGDLWLLEYSMTNDARARRIGKDGVEKIF